jgi:hypothetical protein
MDERRERTKIDEIAKLVEQYSRGFAGVPSATVEFYASPMIYVSPDGVSVFGTRAEAVAFIESILESLRPRGFSYTTVDRCFVNLLKPSIALCGGR